MSDIKTIGRCSEYDLPDLFVISRKIKHNKSISYSPPSSLQNQNIENKILEETSIRKKLFRRDMQSRNEFYSRTKT